MYKLRIISSQPRLIKITKTTFLKIYIYFGNTLYLQHTFIIHFSQ